MPVPFTTAASTFSLDPRVIEAALVADRRKIYNLYFQTDPPREQENIFRIRRLAQRTGVPVRECSDNFLQNVLRSMQAFRHEKSHSHEGVCLEASTLPQRPLQHLHSYIPSNESVDFELSSQNVEDAVINGTSNSMAYTGKWPRHPFFIWLHGVVDVGNAGAIIRSAFFLGVDGVLFSSRSTASMDGAGIGRASAGASEFMELFRVENPESFIQGSRQKGWNFYGAVAPSNADARRTLLLSQMDSSPLRAAPSVLVLGNEEIGLPWSILKLLSKMISIEPGSGAAAKAGVDSLNVSVAAALIMERFMRSPSQNEVDMEKQRRRDRLF